MIWRVAIVAVLGFAAAIGIRSWIQTGDEGAIGKPLVDVEVPTLNTAEQLGETAFNANCASCHGVNAAGQYGVAPPLIHKIYEPNHHGDMAFVLAAKRGVRQHHWNFGSMPPVPNVAETEIASIVAYVRKLQRANGIR